MSTQDAAKEEFMCETNAYVSSDGGEELYLDNVDIVRPEDGRVYLRNLFGEEKIFEGGIKEMRLSKHKILLESGK
jgi:predicted RNA-binding protein